jgi:histidinol-phosphate aminotransferase
MTQPDPLNRLRPDVRAMHAYVVQDATGLVKLDAMENPYPLPPALQQALGERLGQVAINRYPGPRIDTLKQALAQYIHLPAGCSLMLGNGSDELISLLALACAQPGSSVLAPVPGFVMYEMSAKLQGLAFHGVSLTPDFELDVAAMAQAMRQHRPAIVYLAYPNNPTANAWQRGAMQRLIALAAELGSLVVVDEAYQPFASHTWLDEIRAQPQLHSHVLLMRTLSKFGLAGIRLGYMVGPQALIAELDKVRPPYNVSVLNAECALFALEHQDVFAQQAAEIRQQRDHLLRELAALPGVTPFPSQANMILVRVPNAARTFAGMKTAGVLVKNVSTMHTVLNQCLRLTVGTPTENAQMLQALQQAL